MRGYRAKFWAFFILAIVASGIFAASGYLLQQEPDFYRREWNNPANADDSVQASLVLTRLNGLMSDIQDPRQASWGATFSADDLNAFFRERQSGNNPLITGLLGDIPDPRFEIVDDRLLIAFRNNIAQSGDTQFSTVVTIELKIWLVNEPANMVAVQVLSFKAGSMPLPKQMILDRISTMARKQNAEVNWYRHEGQPVAMCQLYANQTRPETVFTTLKIADGRLMIGGRHTNAAKLNGQ